MISNKHFPLIVLVDTSKYTQEQISFLSQFADNYILERNKRTKSENIKINSIVGCVIRKYLLKKIFNIPFENQEIVKNEQGKPFLKNYQDIYFNVSHSQHYVACAISNREIGIDIQSIIPYNPKIANYIFSNNELAILQSSTNKDNYFTTLWTQKESAVKLIGCGMAFHHKQDFSNIQTKTISFKNYIISYSVYKNKK